ncbi:MAG: hypothetical protein JXR80_00425 [Deltaproteobacteria bacterium]|nr:hypothetical protein [Deltaproteobacteria bacterium]
MLLEGHESCFICHDEFCFAAVEDCSAGVATRMVFSLDHEGWQGIPHGGLAMAALLDLADYCSLRKQGVNLAYPLTVDWRFADAVQVGDAVNLKAEFKDESNLLLSMRRPDSDKIYLSAEVEAATAVAGADFPLLEPEQLMANRAAYQALAVYDNCFVCGLQRRKPGLQRRFFKMRDAAGAFSAIIVRFGGGVDGERLAASFQQATGVLHPGVLAALLDELCGWSGVLAGELYGYTVRFNLHINRLPKLGEELFGIAPAPQVRGRGARKFFQPQGVLYHKKNDGELEVVAVATGQWLAREDLRQQFEESHVEEDLAGIIF